MLERYGYSPYGVPRSGRLELGAWLNTGNPFGFTGAEHDPVFGLIGLGARVYSPGAARFLSVDPLLALGGVPLAGNPYEYAAGNPLRYVDPTGLIAERLGIGSFTSQNAFLVHNILTTAGAVSCAMPVILAAPVAVTAAGIIGLAVGSALTVSHIVGAAEDWSAYSRGDYGSVGTNDPIYSWVGGEFGTVGTLALAIAEGVFWLKFPGMTGLTPVTGARVKRAANELADAARGTGPALDDLSRAASMADRGGLTRAGRALAKHGNRPGSAFPRPSGNPKVISQAGQDIVDDMLATPGTRIVRRQTSRYGEVIEVWAPDGCGIRYDKHGNFIGFLEPGQ